MKRLLTAPNIALATLWADMLRHAGVQASVQRAFASSIAGQIPPDQAQPEIWIEDEDRFDEATRLMHLLRNPPAVHWCCAGCGEAIDGPFEVCWNCGAPRPGLPA